MRATRHVPFALLVLGCCTLVACTAPKMVCAGVCTDLESSNDNCGACGRPCLGARCTAHTCGAFLAYPRSDVSIQTLIGTDTDLLFGTTAHDLIQQSVAAGAAPMKLITTQGKIFAIAPSAPKVFFTAQNADGTTWDVWSAMLGTAGTGVAGGGAYGGVGPVGLVAAGGLVHTANDLGGSPASFRI